MSSIFGCVPAGSGTAVFTAPDGSLMQVDILPTASARRVENSFKRICPCAPCASGNPAFAKAAPPALAPPAIPIFKPLYAMLPPRSEKNKAPLAPLTPTPDGQPAAAPSPMVPPLSPPEPPTAKTTLISAKIKKGRSASQAAPAAPPRQGRKAAVPGPNPAVCPPPKGLPGSSSANRSFPLLLDHLLPRQNLTPFSPLQLTMPPAAIPYRPDFAGGETAPAYIIDGRQLYLPAGRYAITALLTFMPGSALPAKMALAAGGVRKKSFLYRDVGGAFSRFFACRQILLKTRLLLPKPDILCLIADTGGSNEICLLGGRLALRPLSAGNRQGPGAYTGKEETGRKEKRPCPHLLPTKLP